MRLLKFFKGLLFGSLAVAFYYGMMVLIGVLSSFVIPMFMYIYNPNVEKSNIFEVMQSSTTFIYFLSGIIIIICLWLFFKIRKKSLTEYCDISKVPAPLLVIPYFLGYGLNLLTNVMIKVIPIPERWVEKHAKSTSFYGPWVIIVISVMILAPVLEEIVFRGLFYRTIKNYSSGWIAALITSVVFGFIHGNNLQAIYAGILGLVLVYSYETAGSLHTPIALHIGFNSANIIHVLFGIDKLPVIVQFILSIILIISLMYALYVIKKKRESFLEKYL